MHGGVSHIDSFDPKERLYRDNGKPLPIKRPLAFAEGDAGPLVKPLWDYKNYGQSGIPVSDLFPHIGVVRGRFVRHSLDVRRGRGSRRGACCRRSPG